MKSDLKIKNDVLEELSWQPNIDETQVGVAVKNGIVTLTGIVSDLTKKDAIESAVKSIAGVKAVAEEIKVKYGDSDKHSDIEIAKAAVDALDWNASVPMDQITVEVDHGTIYLTGEVEWAYQKDFAKRTIENLLGVKEVINNIQLSHKTTANDVADKIEKALERSAHIDSENIMVHLDGNTIVLGGMVHSLKEKDDAEIAAYSAPGVTDVINELEVEYSPVYL